MRKYTDFHERKLTSAELKKREEIAKAIERVNPDMPMDKKMAIATATAKKVNERTWYNTARAKISQITHPKGWAGMVKAYVDGMKDNANQKNPQALANKIARTTKTIDGRDLITYINKLVKKGDLPQELMAQMEAMIIIPESGAGEEGTDELRKKYQKDTPGEECTCFDHTISESEYKGRKVKLNDPTRSSDGKKKFYVYVKNDKGNVIKLGFGDPNMEIKRDDPARRASFRARHNCDDPGPKWKARYWSCYQWRANAKVDN